MVVKTKSKVYTDVCLNRGLSYYDYESFPIEFNDPSKYKIVKKIGRGKYSDVYLGFKIDDEQVVVIKALKAVRRSKIHREVKILNDLKGGPSVIDLIDVVIDDLSKTISMIFELAPGPSYKQQFKFMTNFQCKSYLYKLLMSLNHAHKNGIMHRDVKPINIIYNSAEDELYLLDWGLSDYYLPGKEYPLKVGSRLYKSPELLVGLQSYDYSIDIWAFGVTAATLLISLGDPFFQSQNDEDQLFQIVSLLGSDIFNAFSLKFNLRIPSSIFKNLQNLPKKPLKNFRNDQNFERLSDAAIDLISKSLVMDLTERASAAELMNHEYFADYKLMQNLE